MAVEFKTLHVGGKVVVMRTDGEFDAFEALVVKLSVTRKSALVIRTEHADQLLKEHGAAWMHEALKDEENKDVVRASIDEMFPAVGETAKFIQEFKGLSDERVATTKKMEALANRFGFHTEAKKHEEKAAKPKGKKAKAKKAAEPVSAPQ